MKRLVLFDIDGTLTRTQNGYLPFNEAVLKTFGVAGDIRTVVPDGNTDPLIVREIFARANADITIDRSQWESFSRALELCYSEAIKAGTTTIRPLPGALKLLSALARNETIDQGVVTGNFESTARVKLAAAGLITFIRCGAYADDSEHRPDLPRIAKARWEQSSGTPIRSEHCVVVGDTPKDLEAACENGMKCVLVGTGRYPVEELEYFKPDATVADLTDTGAVIDLLGQI